MNEWREGLRASKVMKEDTASRVSSNRGMELGRSVRGKIDKRREWSVQTSWDVFQNEIEVAGQLHKHFDRWTDLEVDVATLKLRRL